ncbi:hypothetical protein V7138_01295 [Bacillus sp. JJ1533]|uniref:hypothetical protein n=1 Tax=Bacillus sp. JJ1533 TaxID=3122959 RepID=UPI0030004DEF
MSIDILTVLSVMGKVSFEKFKEVYDILLKQMFNRDEKLVLEYSHYTILRELEAMGYCEIDYIKRQVLVCPPSFALLPIRGLPRLVLAGGRSIEMVNYITRLAKKNSDKINVSFVDVPTAKNALFPKSIFVEAKNIFILKQVVKKLKLEGNIEIPASYCLLGSSPSVSEVNNALIFNYADEPNWKKTVFCRENLYFRQFETFDEIRLVKYTNPMSQQHYTWVWFNKNAAAIDISWGRYLILHYYKSKVLLFDSVRKRFAVPAILPLPKQLYKAAIFSTGILPRNKILRKQIGNLNENMNITVFDCISDTIALEISKKLGLDLLEANLS